MEKMTEREIADSGRIYSPEASDFDEYRLWDRLKDVGVTAGFQPFSWQIGVNRDGDNGIYSLAIGPFQFNFRWPWNLDWERPAGRSRG